MQAVRGGPIGVQCSFFFFFNSPAPPGFSPLPQPDALPIPGVLSFRQRLTQAAYRDWLKIRVLPDRLLASLTPPARARRIEEAFRRADPTSWRWERWLGW